MQKESGSAKAAGKRVRAGSAPPQDQVSQVSHKQLNFPAKLRRSFAIELLTDECSFILLRLSVACCFQVSHYIQPKQEVVAETHEP